jgi:hypothetical protein
VARYLFDNFGGRVGQLASQPADRLSNPLTSSLRLGMILSNLATAVAERQEPRRTSTSMCCRRTSTIAIAPMSN